MSDHLIAEANRHARALIIERDQIGTELALLREWQREVIQNANAHHAERKDAIARAERAEAELATERAHTKRLVNAGELVLGWFAIGAPDVSYVKQDLRAAIDAAMKEDAK